MIALSLKIDIFFSSFSNLSINYRRPTPLELKNFHATTLRRNEIYRQRGVVAALRESIFVQT
jgi:hypothetical protein